MHNQNHWDIAFGIKQLPENTQGTQVRKHAGHRIVVGTSRLARHKLDQEILDLLNSGIDTNEGIYESLKQSNKLPKRDDQIMAFTTIVNKIQKVRRKNGLSKRENRPKIIEMINQGIRPCQIIRNMNISVSYFYQVRRDLKGGQ